MCSVSGKVRNKKLDGSSEYSPGICSCFMFLISWNLSYFANVTLILYFLLPFIKYLAVLGILSTDSTIWLGCHLSHIEYTFHLVLLIQDYKNNS